MCDVQHVFIIGAKSIGQYGGYETFVDRLIGEHETKATIKYHVACKANGEGYMDETKLSSISDVVKDHEGKVCEFTYKKAHIFKINCPSIGPAVAIYYDRIAVQYSISYCKKNKIEHPIFYILTCRIGLFINELVKQIKSIGGKYYLNPDGHEWKRAKWSLPVRIYWKWSEKRMVKSADLVICDSINIEKYIRNEYGVDKTIYIAYGADTIPSKLSDNAPEFVGWLNNNGLKPYQYYLVVGRFVPENNYETMIREFMKSHTSKKFAIITNVNNKDLAELQTKLHWKSDSRIKFVGTVYNKELLKKIRESAYGYFHGHEVGGTNPSLLEALGSTKLNLLFDVGFNREVAEDAALYWSKSSGNLSKKIDDADEMDKETYINYGVKAKEIIKKSYSWVYIGMKYEEAFTDNK
ncbi:beta 1-4 rhamnosyltransferase Cps2T [uncultured Anaerovibrio sp.]|uniref:beta 1-4 rhamnosyltransferase Cps2T n=1 Tax=uncultured Anaerovibrio sp. TaxID=361586 RepID=UPI0025DB9923|nr:DUF1972 domain-containing protein [uncultured Anaerovibrio sp.]